MANFVIGLLISLVIPGESAAATQGEQSVRKTELHFVFSGKSYNGLLIQPQINSSKLAHPLLIAASGAGDRLSRFVRATGFSKMANRNGFVVAYIQIDQFDDWYYWLKPSADNVNLAADFFRAIIDSVSGDANILPENIYLTGFSAGGVLVLSAMCSLTSEVAAFGVVAASLPSEWRAKCNTKDPTPAIIFASRDDPVLPWNGGQYSITQSKLKPINVLSISDTVDFWRTNNKCNARPMLEAFANVDPSDRTTVTRLKYDYECQKSSPVLLYAVTGGGHSWPGSILKLRSFEGAVSQDIRASDSIWEFVRKYSLDR